MVLADKRAWVRRGDTPCAAAVSKVFMVAVYQIFTVTICKKSG